MARWAKRHDRCSVIKEVTKSSQVHCCSQSQIWTKGRPRNPGARTFLSAASCPSNTSDDNSNIAADKNVPSAASSPSNTVFSFPKSETNSNIAADRNVRAPGLRVALALAVLLTVASSPARAASVVIDGSQTYQVIDGFGANVNYYNWVSNDLRPVLDSLIDDAGMTLFRVVFRSNWETSNDNTDPAVMDWAYYNGLYAGPEFQKLWGLIGYLNQRGITNGVILNLQGPGPNWMGGDTLTTGYEGEWAEMVASL